MSHNVFCARKTQISAIEMRRDRNPCGEISTYDSSLENVADYFQFFVFIDHYTKVAVKRCGIHYRSEHLIHSQIFQLTNIIIWKLKLAQVKLA